MKKTVFLVMLIILVITLSQFMAVAEDNYSYASDISSMLNSKGCPECHGFMGEYSLIRSKKVFVGGVYIDLIVPSKPDSSVFMWKLTGKDINGDDVFGNRMPAEGQYYTDEEIAVLRAWISQGALFETPPVGVEDTRSWIEIKSKFQ